MHFLLTNYSFSCFSKTFRLFVLSFRHTLSVQFYVCRSVTHTAQYVEVSLEACGTILYLTGVTAVKTQLQGSEQGFSVTLDVFKGKLKFTNVTKQSWTDETKQDFLSQSPIKFEFKDPKMRHTKTRRKHGGGLVLF